MKPPILTTDSWKDFILKETLLLFLLLLFILYLKMIEK